MPKKNAFLLFVTLTLICTKLSPDNFGEDLPREPKTLELSGLKIKTPKKIPESHLTLIENPISLEKPEKNKVEECLPLAKKEEYKKNFIQKNKSELKKILGIWVLEKSDKIEFDYESLKKMNTTSFYASGLYADKKISDFNSKTENNPGRFIASNFFYKIFYKDRSNSDTIFYLFKFYSKLKYDKSSQGYLKSCLKETSKYKALSLEVWNSLIKLSKDPETLLGAFEVLKNYKGLSSSLYKKVLNELETGTQISIAREMIKTGAEKTNINEYLEWSPGAYSAAYQVLKENDMARSYLPISDLRETKEDSHKSFINILSSAKTTCDLEEAWSVAGPVIREL